MDVGEDDIDICNGMTLFLKGRKMYKKITQT